MADVTIMTQTADTVQATLLFLHYMEHNRCWISRYNVMINCLNYFFICRNHITTHYHTFAETLVPIAIGMMVLCQDMNAVRPCIA